MIFRVRKCLTKVSSISPGIIHLVAVLASTLPWSFFIQLRRLSGLPWRRLSPPSFLRVSPSLFTAIPTSSSAHKPDLVPACLCLSVSVLPDALTSKTFCQLWKRDQPQTVPSGPLHCSPLEAWFWDPSQVPILDSIRSLPSCFLSLLRKASLSPMHRTKGFTAELWIPEHPGEVGAVTSLRDAEATLSLWAKSRTTGSDRQSCLALPSQGLITSL